MADFEDTIGDLAQEESVVADQEQCSLVALQRIQKHFTRTYVEMVRGLVQNQTVVRG